MIIRTKKHRMKQSIYRKIGVLNILRRKQWWISSLALLVLLVSFLIGHWGWGIICCVGGFGLYLGFLFAQFSYILKSEEGKMLFKSITYHISSREIVMQLTPKQAMTIKWKDIKYSRKRKRCFVLFLNKVQFIYLPYKIFPTPEALRFMQYLFKRKTRIK